MTINYGNAASFEAVFGGPYGGTTGNVAKIVSVSLPVSGWKGANSPYSQEVTVEGISVNSKVDLQADATALAALLASRTEIYIENDGGEATAWAVGGQPTENLTLQACLTEVTT